jgi:uncharacterized protein YbjT (DUF2867 family)
MRILITGGTGRLGKLLARGAIAAGHSVRIMSRQPRSITVGQNMEWVQADLSSGSGLETAVKEMDAVFHCASDPRRPKAVDVEGTKLLLAAARKSSISHLLFISIVGIDRIPFGYYQRKLEAEHIIKQSGFPSTILRATQFHSFLDQLIRIAARLPLLLLLPTDFKFQTVDEAEVATGMLEQLGLGPGGSLADFGGPETLTLGEMLGPWKKVRKVNKPVVHLRLPGKVAAAFREGRNTTPKGLGKLNWTGWLKQNYPN